MSYIDLTNKVFGFWTVLERTSQKKIVTFMCRCECGTVRAVLAGSLKSGKSLSCGCQGGPEPDALRRAHRGAYVSWLGMKNRCNYRGHVEYHRYGGRGITYDPRWHKFEAFFEDMGPRPDGMSIDREDNDKPYCKDNCRWTTREEQSSNRTRNVMVEWGGQLFTLKRLAKHLDVSYDLLHNWHRTRGLPLDAAVFRALERSPVGSNKPFVPTYPSGTDQALP